MKQEYESWKGTLTFQRDFNVCLHRTAYTVKGSASSFQRLNIDSRTKWWRGRKSFILSHCQGGGGDEFSMTFNDCHCLELFPLWNTKETFLIQIPPPPPITFLGRNHHSHRSGLLHTFPRTKVMMSQNLITKQISPFQPSSGGFQSLMLGNMVGKKSICKANILTAIVRVRQSIDLFLEVCSTHPLLSLCSEGETEELKSQIHSCPPPHCTSCDPSVAFRAMQKLWVQSEDLSYMSRKQK